MTPDQAYDICFPIFFGDEGGVIASNNPADPGGYTRGGIALNEHPEITRDQLDAMTWADFKAWYKPNFWLKYNCDLLPFPVCLVVVDGCVNAGSEGVRALQTALGITADGVNGPITQFDAAARDPVELACLTAVAREAFYQSEPDAGEFGKGWLKRLFWNMYQAGFQTGLLSQQAAQQSQIPMAIR